MFTNKNYRLKMMSLTSDHRRIISDNDRKAKQEFLGKLPNVSNPGVRMHQKYLTYAKSLQHWTEEAQFIHSRFVALSI